MPPPTSDRVPPEMDADPWGFWSWQKMGVVFENGCKLHTNFENVSTPMSLTIYQGGMGLQFCGNALADN